MATENSLIDPNEQAVLLKSLWEEREKAGLLNVLDKMNVLLDKGLLTPEDFQKVLSGEKDGKSAPEKKKMQMSSVDKLRSRIGNADKSWKKSSSSAARHSASLLLPANEVVHSMESPPPKTVMDILSPGDSKDLDLQAAIKNSLFATNNPSVFAGDEDDNDILKAIADLEKETMKFKKINHEKEERKKAAASTRIVGAARLVIARKKLIQLKEQKKERDENERRQVAAINKVQRAVRSAIAVKKLATLKNVMKKREEEEKRKAVATTSIQSATRSIIARRKLARLIKARDENERRQVAAINKVQRAVRSAIAVRKLATLKNVMKKREEEEEKRKAAATTSIQSATRSVIARRKLARLKEQKKKEADDNERREVAAINRIQCAVRSTIAIRKFAVLKSDSMAAITLQSKVRQLIASKEVLNLKLDRIATNERVVLLQSVFRKHLVKSYVKLLRKERMERERSITKLQSAWRRSRSWKEALKSPSSPDAIKKSDEDARGQRIAAERAAEHLLVAEHPEKQTHQYMEGRPLGGTFPANDVEEESKTSKTCSEKKRTRVSEARHDEGQVGEYDKENLASTLGRDGVQSTNFSAEANTCFQEEPEDSSNHAAQNIVTMNLFCRAGNSTFEDVRKPLHSLEPLTACTEPLGNNTWAVPTRNCADFFSRSMPKLALDRLDAAPPPSNDETAHSRCAKFGGHIKIRKNIAENSGVKLIKVLSDSDDHVTLAIKRADRREKNKMRKLKEHRRRNNHMNDRNFIRGKVYVETGASLPTPTIRKGYRAKLNESSVTNSVTLALHHIKRHGASSLSGSVVDVLPDFEQVQSVRRKTAMLDNACKRMEELEKAGWGRKKPGAGCA